MIFTNFLAILIFHFQHRRKKIVKRSIFLKLIKIRDIKITAASNQSNHADWFDDGLVERIGWFEYWQTKPLDAIGLVELVYVGQKGWRPIKWG